MVKKLCVGLCCISAAFLLSGCVFFSNFSHKCVMINVHEDYRDKFENEEFTLADFEWDNFDALIFDGDSSGMCIFLRLKQTGRRQALDAVAHLEKLPFVWSAQTLETYVDRWLVWPEE